MKAYDYFKSYEKYFWQWEENGDVIAIPHDSTIAYKDFVTNVLEKLSPQGIPPFGSLLLAIIATNPGGGQSIDTVFSIVRGSLSTNHEYTLSPAMTFLKLLAEVPEQYKKGKNRVLLFQAIFEGCHNSISAKSARSILDNYAEGESVIATLLGKHELNEIVFYNDFKTIGLLEIKFQSVQSILEKIASLPEIGKEMFLIDRDELGGDKPKDFIDELVSNDKTFYVGSLIKRIWSGLNIPVHSALPSEQPLGGISDLTNKGDFDKLLISEFANDDLVFLSRLANNEALYIHREIPPADNELQRVILIDVSLKNWGTPKTLAFAIMVALARHPKTDIECSAFAIGAHYYPLSIESIDSIIDGLQLLDGTMNAAAGLEAFFKEYPAGKNRELIVITEPSILKQVSWLKVINENHAAVTWWIYTDSEGGIDVYKKQQNGKKHLQHMQLPLQELWKREIKAHIKQEGDKGIPYPILFRNSLNTKKTLSAPDGEIFQVTIDKGLLQLYDLSSPYEKGWDLIRDNLPFIHGEFEMGFSQDGKEYSLLMFNPNKKEVTLLNVKTGEQKSWPFPEWKYTAGASFAYLEGCFHHRNNDEVWMIAPEGPVTSDVPYGERVFTLKRDELNTLSNKYFNRQSIFKNVHHIFINEANNLVFNIHELILNQGKHIKLEKTGFLEHCFEASRINDAEFQFTDGSRVEIDRNGMFILKSSNTDIPYIYVPSVLDAALGVATENSFAGNEYYYKEPLFEVNLHRVGKNKLEIVKLIKEFTGKDLKECKEIVDKAPMQLMKRCPHTKALKIREEMQPHGLIVELIKHASESGEQEKLSTSSFFEGYINAFINTIKSNGA